ncbi:hypothetical protein [Actinacidiphila glaucinigra]|uniref:hypothetical protein n=1 Tax=Actinacidiphila glaucinigra TaxID=235986 RepID=UPI002E315EA4|nr:hypothetical protein [Actinacidiphila glaucinigra]
MPFLRCRIVRRVDDEPQPGLVEVRFTDAHDRQWVFVEKSAVVSEAHCPPAPATRSSRASFATP